MNHQISSVILDDKPFKRYDADTADYNGNNYTTISNLSKFNVFIGANNSGKSNFLRELAATPKYIYKANIDYSFINHFINECQIRLGDFISKMNSQAYREVGLEKFREELKPISFYTEGDNLVQKLDEFFNIISSQSPLPFVQGNMRIMDRRDINDRLIPMFSELSKKKLAIDDLVNNYKQVKFKRLYIPTLRGLRGLNGDIDCYLERTKSDYFTGDNCPEIYTGLGFYNELKNLLLGNLADREIVRDFQSFLSDNFFNNQEVALIPRKDDNVIYVKIGNEEEFPIYKLGDGIQSIICLTFPLFVNK